jgi:hypothetical protein
MQLNYTVKIIVNHSAITMIMYATGKGHTSQKELQHTQQYIKVSMTKVVRQILGIKFLCEVIHKEPY